MKKSGTEIPLFSSSEHDFDTFGRLWFPEIEQKNRCMNLQRSARNLFAERRGFEPLKPFGGLLAFQAGQFNHSCIFPSECKDKHNFPKSGNFLRLFPVCSKSDEMSALDVARLRISERPARGICCVSEFRRRKAVRDPCARCMPSFHPFRSTRNSRPADPFVFHRVLSAHC